MMKRYRNIHKMQLAKERARRQSASSEDETTSPSNEAQANQYSDIPGYYYDEEKKNYFKILPNSMSSVSSFVTRDKLKKKTDEKRRCSDLNGETTRGGQGSSKSAGMSSVVKKSALMDPLLRVLYSVQCGQSTCQTLQRQMVRRRCLGLRPQPDWKHGQTVDVIDVQIDGIRKLEMTADYKRAVIVWSTKVFISQYIKLTTLTAREKQLSSDAGRHLNVEMGDAGFQGVTADKVTSLCWSPLTGLPGTACILYTSVCPVSYSRSRASIINLETATGQPYEVFKYDLGKSPVWSCAWNSHRHRLSVGCDRKCHVVDVETRSKWTYYSQYSDSLAQLFSPTNPHILYTGNRKGVLLTIDLRRPDNKEWTAKLNHRSPVVCIRPLRDDNYLMASDFSGLIRLWDLRVRKTVRSYRGLANSHYQLPFYLDDTEKFICATGSDSYSHVWDATDGVLLKTIPPPLPVQPDSFPVCHVAQAWAGTPGNFGVVLAMADRLFAYS